MIEVEVNGTVYEFPDNMSQSQIKAALDKQFGGSATGPAATRAVAAKPAYKSTWRDPVRAVLQGMTFGWADEIGSAVAAPFGALATGNNVVDVYKDMQRDISGKQKQYRAENPVTATGLELAGGLATGGIGGVKALGTTAAKTLPKWAGAGLLGAVEGGMYGAGAADQGERLEGGATGAAIGAVAAPVAGWAGEKVINGAGNVAGILGRKLTETPRNQAMRLIRDRADDAGLAVDDVVQRYRDLGPDGTLMDVDENLRLLGRTLSDQSGPMKREARNLLESRQAGQIDRLKAATRGAISGDDAVDTVKALIAERSAKAGPLYERAMTASPTDDMINLAQNRPSLAKALTAGRRLAADMGDAVDTPMVTTNGKPSPVYDFKQFHYAKMALDNDIDRFMRSGDSVKARAAMTLKKDLLGMMDQASPDYAQARQIFADESSLISAVDKGRKAFQPSTTVREFTDMTDNLTDGELEMFRRGAVQSILERLDNTQQTHDAAKRLISTPAMKSKLMKLFKSQDDALAFIQQAAREGEFTRTRQVVAGGSPTSQNVQAGKEVANALNDIGSIASQNPIAIGQSIVARLFGNKPPSPETIGEASRLLLAQGLTEAQIREVFARSPIIQQASRMAPGIPNATRGMVVPAYQPILGGNQ